MNVVKNVLNEICMSKTILISFVDSPHESHLELYTLTKYWNSITYVQNFEKKLLKHS